MAERLGDAVLELRTGDKDYYSGVDRAEGRANRLGRRFDEVGRSMTRVGRQMTVAITAPIVALGLLSASLADVQIQAERRLGAAISAAGSNVTRELPVFKDFASTLQSITTVGDEATLANAQVARSMGLSAAQAASAAKNAIALAKAFGINERSAIRYTAALEQGDTTMLNRYIPTLRNIEDQSQRVAEAQRILANAFEVAMAEAREGLGPYRQMKNDLGDLLEQFGEIVLTGINPFIQELREGVKWVQGLSREAKVWVVGAVAFAASFGPAVLGLGLMVRAIGFAIQGLSLLAFTTIPAMVRALASLSTALLAAAWPAVLAAGAAVLAQAAVEGKSFSKVIAENIEFLSGKVGELAGNVKKHLPKGLADLLFGGADPGDGGGKPKDALARIRELLAELEKLGGSTGGLADGAADKIKDVIDALKFERDQLGRTALEQRVANELRAAGIDATHEQAEAIRTLVEEIERERRRQGILGALKDYSDAALSIGKQIGEATVNAFRGMEDALVEFVTTGKVSFSDLARSIIADLARIAARAYITGPLAAALLGALGGGDLFGNLKLPGFAHGASFTVDGAPGIDRNLVAFRATAGERVDVTPAGQQRSEGGRGYPSIIFNVNTPDVESFRRSETQLTAMMTRAVMRGQRNL